MTRQSTRRLAAAGRMLVALLFLQSGAGKLLALQATSGFITSAGVPFAQVAAPMAALFEIACGLALLLGFHAAKAALALALFTCVATLLFHGFWAAPPNMQMMQKILFMKNLAIVGALLHIAAVHADSDETSAVPGITR